MGPSRTSSVWTSSPPSGFRRREQPVDGVAGLVFHRAQAAIMASSRSQKSCSRSAMPCIGSVAVSSRSAGFSAFAASAKVAATPFPPVADRGQLRSHSGEPGLARDRRGLTKEAGVHAAEDVDGLGVGGGGAAHQTIGPDRAGGFVAVFHSTEGDSGLLERDHAGAATMPERN